MDTKTGKLARVSCPPGAPPMDEELRSGSTDRLLEWLRAKVHTQGYRRDAKVLAADIAGEPVTARPLLDYLGDKYRTLYPSS